MCPIYQIISYSFTLHSRVFSIPSDQNSGAEFVLFDLSFLQILQSFLQSYHLVIV